MTYDNFSTHIPPECYEWLWIIEELQNIFIHWKDLKVPFTKAPRLLPAPAAGQQTSSRQPHSWRWPSPHKSPKDTKSRMNGRHQRLQQEQYSLAIRRTTIFKKTAAAKIIMTMTPATTRTTIATLKTTKKTAGAAAAPTPCSRQHMSCPPSWPVESSSWNGKSIFCF